MRTKEKNNISRKVQAKYKKGKYKGIDLFGYRDENLHLIDMVTQRQFAIIIDELQKVRTESPITDKKLLDFVEQEHFLSFVK